VGRCDLVRPSESRLSSGTWWVAGLESELRREATQFLVNVTTVLLLVFCVSQSSLVNFTLEESSAPLLKHTLRAHGLLQCRETSHFIPVLRVVSSLCPSLAFLASGLLLKSYALNLPFLRHKPDLMQSRIFHVLVLIPIILSQINYSCASSSDSRRRPRRQLCLRNSEIRPCTFLLEHFRPPACSSLRT
jgi:hypothetical protein